MQAHYLDRGRMMAVRPMIAFQRFHGISNHNRWFGERQTAAQDQRQEQAQRHLGSPAAMHRWEEAQQYNRSSPPRDCMRRVPADHGSRLARGAGGASARTRG